MKIDILAVHGSPLGVTLNTLRGEDGQLGVGGAELALLTMCETWAEEGHEVTLYNNPRVFTETPFRQRGVHEFIPSQDRDVVIAFRAPNRVMPDCKGLKVWWSTDQFTIGDYRAFAPLVDKIVCISPYHKEYFNKHYGIHKAITIDLPVRLKDYAQSLVKIPNRLIFTSVPTRGLDILADYWMDIKRDVPDASLVITSDFRLWGQSHAGNEAFRMKWLGKPDVNFMGAIPRHELIKQQLQAEVLAYPCSYEELFCYTVAESCVAGTYPITTGIGAIPTTTFGTVIDGDPTSPVWKSEFISTIVDFLSSKNKEQIGNQIRKKASMRYAPYHIAQQWKKKVFGDNG